MHVAGFDEPRLARPLVGRGRFVVKAHRDVIEPRVLRLLKVGLIQEFLERRTNPRLSGGPKRRKGGYPGIGEVLCAGIGTVRQNLWPRAIALYCNVGSEIKSTQIGSALDSLRATAHTSVNWDKQGTKNRDNYEDDEELENGKG